MNREKIIVDLIKEKIAETKNVTLIDMQTYMLLGKYSLRMHLGPDDSFLLTEYTERLFVTHISRDTTLLQELYDLCETIYDMEQKTIEERYLDSIIEELKGL